MMDQIASLYGENSYLYLNRTLGFTTPVQLVGAGGEPTAGLIGTAARRLATHDDLQKQVRADPDLLPLLLEETVRLESPFRAHHRHVITGTTLDGVDLPAKQPPAAALGRPTATPSSSNIPTSRGSTVPTRAGIWPLGKGVHFCVGAALARTEARIALRTLLDNAHWLTSTDARWLPGIFVRRHHRLELAFD